MNGSRRSQERRDRNYQRNNVELFLRFPDHLFIYLRSFLSRRPWSYDDRVEEYEFHLTDDRPEELQENFQWINFMRTTKAFREIKRKTIYLSLGPIYSSLFVTDCDFRNYILTNIVANPKIQLNLNITSSDHISSLFYEENFPIIHCLKIDRNYLNENIHELTKKVNILRIAKASDIPEEISGIENIQILNLHQTKSLHSFSFGNTFSKLYLHGCDQLEDISSLKYCKNLKSLFLGCCYHIRNGFEIFLQLKELFLFRQDLQQSENYQYMKNIKKLSIECDLLLKNEDFPGSFPNVEDISLVQCSSLMKLSHLPKATVCYIDECEIKSIDFMTLPRVQTMYLVENHSLERIHIPNYLPSLMGNHADGNDHNNREFGLKKLSINGCLNLRFLEIEVPTMQRLSFLELNPKEDDEEVERGASQYSLFCVLRSGVHPVVRIRNSNAMVHNYP